MIHDTHRCPIAGCPWRHTSLDRAQEALRRAATEKVIEKASAEVGEIKALEVEIALLENRLKLHRLRTTRDHLKRELEDAMSRDSSQWTIQEAIKRQTIKG